MRGLGEGWLLLVVVLLVLGHSDMGILILCFAFQYNHPLAYITFPTCNTKLCCRLSECHNLLYYRISESWLSSLPHSSCLLLVVDRQISFSKYYEVQIHQRSSASLLASCNSLTSITVKVARSQNPKKNQITSFIVIPIVILPGS